MKRLFLALIFCAMASTSWAQTFEGLQDRKGNQVYDAFSINVFGRYTNFADPYNKTVSGITFNFGYRVGSSRKGGVSYQFENPTLGDFIFVLFNWKKVKASNDDKAFGSGFFGWHQVYWNVIAKDRFLLSPGISLGDYIFGINKPNSDPVTLEPNGYYFHAGPAIKASYLINDKMWVEGFLHNDIGFKAGKPSGKQNIKGYERPFFLNFGATLYSKSRFFGGFRVAKLIDRGVNDLTATRLDVSVGYMIRR
jgi:hypothetical protein